MFSTCYMQLKNAKRMCFICTIFSHNRSGYDFHLFFENTIHFAGVEDIEIKKAFIAKLSGNSISVKKG